jgi:chaperonin cofactor prefoldin
MKIESTNSLLEHLKQFWFIYAFVGQFIVNYSFINNTLAQHTKRLDILEIKVERTDLNLAEIKTTLAEIKTSIKYIEQRVK